MTAARCDRGDVVGHGLGSGNSRAARSARRIALRSDGEWTVRARVICCIATLFSINGCSLVSFQSPERPLSTRDLNARILTREYSADFITAVEQTADDISLKEPGPQVQIDALRWKIAVTTQSQRAAMQMAPMMALLDSWTLAVQMNTFLAPGNPGGTLFGNHQWQAEAVANRLNGTAEDMAHRIIGGGKEFEQYQKFVDSYTRAYPLKDLGFARPSVVELWSRAGGSSQRLVDSLGTVPEALADVSDRLRMLGDNVPSETMWKTQLALAESGMSGGEIQAALRQLDQRLEKMSAAAETAPELVHGAVADVRRSVLEVLDRLDATSARMIEALRTERIALAANVSSEREVFLNAADTQRKALAEDAVRVADRVVKSSGQEVRALARQVLLLLTVMFAVVLGLPFAAGYVVGRARRGDGPRQLN